MMKAERDIVKALAMRENESIIGLMSHEDLTKSTIPIYTKKNPHPTRKRQADCAIEVQYKQGLRQSMLLELRLGGNKDAIIQKYQMKVSEI